MKELELKARMMFDRYQRPVGCMWYLKVVKDSGEVSEYISPNPFSSIGDCYNDFTEWMDKVKDEMFAK